VADVLPAELHDDLELLRRRCEAMPLGSPERLATQRALQLIDGWAPGNQDYRTRANIKAVLSLAIGPLLEPSVQKILRATPRHRFQIEDAITRGRLLVVSLPAMQNPELCSLVARCLKADYYRSVFRRRPGGRLVMLIGDEFHLAVTSGNVRYDDCHALPLMRSQNAGVVAATQTLAGVDRMIGNLNRKVLLGNFGTVFFLRSTEPEVEAWAHQVCGTVEIEVTERVRLRDHRTDGGVLDSYERSVTRKVRRPVCTPGALARLETGQAFVLQEGVAPSRYPLWLAGGPH
jgi:type IV secretory pathway TraG/TraD family ATPase VirD4